MRIFKYWAYINLNNERIYIMSVLLKLTISSNAVCLRISTLKWQNIINVTSV